MKAVASAVSGAASERFVPKRGRPTQAQVAAIEASIVRVARELFLEQGYASTSMEAVAASSGVSKGTLYARYPTKADLFEAIVEDRLHAWRTEGHLPETPDEMEISERLIWYGTFMLESLSLPEVRAFDRLILSESDRFPELAQKFYDRGYRGAVDQLADMIRSAGAIGGWSTANPRKVAEAFISALLGWFRSTSAIRKLKADECGVYVATLVAIFVGGRPAW